MLKLLYIGVTPIQNAKPYRLLEDRHDVSSTVVYLADAKSSGYAKKENITKAAFDNDLLSGYKHVILNTEQKATGFFAYGFKGIKQYVQESDIVIIYGHNYFAFWIAMFVAKWNRKKLILTNDATYIEATAESSGCKMKLKPAFLRFLYNVWSDAVFVPSTAAKNFLLSQGIQNEKIVVTPYVVDEDLIERTSFTTNVTLFRNRIGIDENEIVFVFCAKFIERKRPMDAINAFAMIDNINAKLIMIGDGPLTEELKKRAAELNLNSQILFPGLVQYTELPKYYTISNALVFCSDHEPYGLPVNESMICGTPVIVSDRIGARLDLVEENNTGWIYRTGDVNELSKLMNKVALRQYDAIAMKKNCKKKMQGWSSEVNINNQLQFFKEKHWFKQDVWSE